MLARDGTRVEVPTACAVFPQELLSWPPRSYVERMYNATQWTEMPRGGLGVRSPMPEAALQRMCNWHSPCA